MLGVFGQHNSAEQQVSNKWGMNSEFAFSSSTNSEREQEGSTATIVLTGLQEGILASKGR